MDAEDFSNNNFSQAEVLSEELERDRRRYGRELSLEEEENG